MHVVATFTKFHQTFYTRTFRRKFQNTNNIFGGPKFLLNTATGQHNVEGQTS
jgi:hypothetical protein